MRQHVTRHAAETYRNHVKPGFLEVYTGTMRSGKTRELINHLDRLAYVKDCAIVLAKPSVDTRDPTVKSRYGELALDCTLLDAPEDIFGIVTDSTRVVAFDEMQLFPERFVRVMQRLLHDRFYVLGAGLDLDFRGEPFGPMPSILALADRVHKLHAICAVDDCNALASRPQRLIDGKPAPYDSAQILVGSKEYEPRCIQHHIVPGRPW